jgi:uncharacterized protein YpmS
MEKTTRNKAGVKGITSLAEKLNSKIGAYEEHYFNDNFDYTVKLSNGSITRSTKIAQDFETMPKNISEDRVKAVANTFQKF